MRDNVIRIDGAEEVSDSGAVNLTELRRMLPELLALAGAKADAAAMFSAAVDAAAYHSRVGKSAIRKLVSAMHADRLREAREEATELADLIEAVEER